MYEQGLWLCARPIGFYIGVHMYLLFNATLSRESKASKSEVVAKEACQLVPKLQVRLVRDFTAYPTDNVPHDIYRSLKFIVSKVIYLLRCYSLWELFFFFFRFSFFKKEKEK